MSAGAPWSVKGIDPKAREIAKDLARRSGMTLGEWLNQMIMEGDAEEDSVVTPITRRAQPPQWTGQGQDRRSRARRIEDAYPPETPAIETEGDLGRVADALDHLSSRMEAAENRSTLAISGVNAAVNGLLSRLEAGEQAHAATAARVEHIADDLRDEHDRILDRVRDVERQEGAGRSVEALRSLETALGKIANQVYEGDARTRAVLQETSEDIQGLGRRIERIETQGPTAAAAVDTTAIVADVVARISERLEQAEARTSGAIRALESAFGHLDARLQVTEAQVQVGADAGLEKLAADLSTQVDEARAELAARIDAAASDGRVVEIDRAMTELAGHVRAAEARSAQAIERMGHEVVRIAQNLNQRVDKTEKAAAQAATRTQGEMARMAQAVEQRMRKSDDSHAVALERLGAEIGRISEQLSERIAHSERRASLNAEDMGERVGRLADKLEARYERASGEISERIRKSEERTQRLLEEARSTIDRGLGRPTAINGIEAQPRTITIDPAPQEILAAVATPAPLHTPSIAERAPPPLTVKAPPTSDLVDALFRDFPTEPAPATPETAQEAGEPAFPTFAPAAEIEGEFHAPDADLDALFVRPERTSIAEQTFEDQGIDDFAGETEFLDTGEARIRPPLSTKEAIDAARAAARLGVRNSAPEVTTTSLFNGGVKRAGKSKLQERVAKETRREGSTLKNALMASGVAVVLVTSGYGYMRLMGEDSTDAKAPAGDLKIAAKDATPLTAEGNSTPLAAVAVAPASPAQASAPIGDQAQAVDLYQDAVSKLGRGQNAGVTELSKAANLGYAPAQFFLASLYTNGDSGVHKDLAEARRWTERAALGGDRRAMFNLGMFYYEGTGGQADQSEAVKWFHKAADLGLVDSQYNLARLYEQGLGVARDPAEALKWYLIAARSGDQQSKDSAEALKSQLSDSERAAAEDGARRFRVGDGKPEHLAAR